LSFSALADDNGALHVDRAEGAPHGVDGTPIGGQLVTPALERGRGQRRRLGDAEQLEGQVAIHQLRGGHACQKVSATVAGGRPLP